MSLSLPSTLRAARTWSFPVQLSLALAPLALWFLNDCWQVDLAASQQRFLLSITAVHWQPQGRWGPLLLAVGGLLLLGLRRRLAPQAPATRHLQLRLLRLAAATAALLLLRLLALWDPALQLFPFLSLLWSPPATWALGLFYLLFPNLLLPAPGADGPGRRSNGWIAVLLFLAGWLLYGYYTLYFCQVTMLHGDEGQYLRVTQSLLHDGDMDLANNLEPEYTDEFHIVPFLVDPAPASPPGKIHSVHPIGLSVVLLPAYWLGLELWANPRLAAALFMAVIAAACLPLAFLWLLRLRIARPTALAATLIMAATAPFFLFVNQLFPEIPALFITFCLLFALAHWQVPGGQYRSLGRAEPLLLGGLGLLLDGLPFLHPRYAPLAILGGLLLLLQAWRSPRRQACLLALGLAFGLGLGALLSFNYSFSGDGWGPFRPGNAWKEDALAFSTWSISLPGQWLHVRKGLLNISPLFFFSLVGAVDLARRRDRRLLVFLLLYGATAAANGLHTDWGFGFCFPARFLVTALPALLLGLAWAIPRLAARGSSFFLAVAALIVGLEGVRTILSLTELGFDGRGLLERSFNPFYPWQIHFFAPRGDGPPLFDLGFWALLLAAASAVLVFRRPSRPLHRGGVFLAVGLLPFLWGRSATYGERLPETTFRFARFLLSEQPRQIATTRQYPLRILDHPTGELQADNRFAARAPDHEFGLVANIDMNVPFQSALYHLNFADFRLAGPPGQVVGHLLVSRKYTPRALSLWAERQSWPLVAGTPPEALTQIPFFSAGPAFGYLYVEFSGFGQLAFTPEPVSCLPSYRPVRRTEIARFPVDANPGSAPGTCQVHIPGLSPGLFTVRFVLQGSAFPAFFQRWPAAVLMAAYTGPPPPDPQSALLERRVQEWFQQDREELTVFHSPDYLRPQVEVIQAPWWQAVPFVGEEYFGFDLLLREPREVWLLLRYTGEFDLKATEVVLYQQKVLL